MLAAHGGEARPLAGGQSLVPLLNFRLARPAVLVDINRIEALSRFRVSDGVPLHRCHGPPGGGRGRSGRGARLAAADRVHRSHRPSADSQPRHRRRQPGPQRSGGRAAGGDAGARCGNDRSRPTGAAHDPRPETLFAGTMETALAPDELLTEIGIPALPEGAGWGFQEAARRQGDFALVAVAILLRPSDDGAGGLDGPRRGHTGPEAGPCACVQRRLS